MLAAGEGRSTEGEWSWPGRQGSNGRVERSWTEKSGSRQGGTVDRSKGGREETGKATERKRTGYTRGGGVEGDPEKYNEEWSLYIHEPGRGKEGEAAEGEWWGKSEWRVHSLGRGHNLNQ